MIVSTDDALVLTGYPLSRLRRWLCRRCIRGHRLRRSVWQIDDHSLRAYLCEMKRLESAESFKSAARRKGGLRRAQAFTREYQQRVRACVRHDSNVANGRLGGKAYVRKYGKKKLVERARLYRLAHPSNLERSVRGALHYLGSSDFEREAYIFPKSRVRVLIGDFVFRRAHAVVYADGDSWHRNLPSLARCAERGTRDEHYDNYLRYCGWQVLRLSEDEILQYERAQKDRTPDNGHTFLQKLRSFLGKHHALSTMRSGSRSPPSA